VFYFSPTNFVVFLTTKLKIFFLECENSMNFAILGEEFAKFSMRQNWKKDPPNQQNQAEIPPPKPTHPPPSKTQSYYGNECKWGLMEWNIPSLFLFSKGQLF
jgi:hypothetical protein